MGRMIYSILLAMAVGLCSGPASADEVHSSSGIGILVTTGSDQDALDYYSELGLCSV
jgi:hypothetical protein